jgi:serine/threonine protein kinase
VELTGINIPEKSRFGKNRKHRERIWSFLPYYVPTETVSPRKRVMGLDKKPVEKDNACGFVYDAVLKNARDIKSRSITEHYKSNVMSANLFVIVRSSSSKKKGTNGKKKREIMGDDKTKNVHFIVVKKSNHAKREFRNSETLYKFLAGQSGVKGEIIMNAFASMSLDIIYSNQSIDPYYPSLLKKDALFYRPAIYGDCIQFFSNIRDLGTNIDLRRKVCKQIIYQLLIITEHIHSLDIVHRDIKLDNVVVMDTNLIDVLSNKAKESDLYIWINLVDWEFSTKIGDIDHVHTSYLNDNLFKIPGSLEYAAPEIFIRKNHISSKFLSKLSEIDCMAVKTTDFLDQKYYPKACDIFSIGMTMATIISLSSIRSEFSALSILNREEIDFFNLCCQPIAKKRRSSSELLKHPFLNDVRVDKKDMGDYVRKFANFGKKNIYYRKYTRKLYDLVKERENIDDLAIKAFLTPRKKKRNKRKKPELILNK